MTVNLNEVTEISYSAMKSHVETLVGEPLASIQVTDSLTKVVVPQKLGITVVTEDIDTTEGIKFYDQNGNDITDSIVVVTFGCDATENGSYLLEGIRNGVLTITGHPRITDSDIEEMVKYDN